jgi:signal-transduction protein with cAMP-binding, CBS, and nucleotidyltransferase domain
VGCAQALQQVPAPAGELQSHESAVVRVGQAAHQPGFRGAIDQLDGAVVEPGLDPGSPVARVAIRDVVVVGPGESVYAALSRMVEEGVDHLPVVDGGRVVGMCTRADLLQARIRELDQERVERGWLPARLPSIGP